MSKKEDKIKVLIEKARRGDAKELSLLIRAFSKWLRSSYTEEVSQHSVRRLIDKFLQNLNKIVRQVEKMQNANAKTRAVQMLSRLVETIYSTGESGIAIKYIKRIIPGIERIREDKAGAKSLGDIINLLAELPQQTALESPPANNRKSSPIRKKRAGCVGGGSNGGGNGDGNGDGGTTTVDDFIGGRIKHVIENKITDTVKDKIKERLGQLKGHIKAATVEDFITDRIGPVISPEVKEILGHPKDGVKTELIQQSKIGKVDQVIKEKIDVAVERESRVDFRAHWQRYTMPGSWAELVVLLYSGISGEKKANAELLKHMRQLNKLDFDTAGPVLLKNGTEILVKPEMTNFRFSPKESIVIWYEDYLPVKFEMMPDFAGQIPKQGKKVHGQVRFYVGPLPIAEIDISVIVKKHLSREEKFIENEAPCSAYQNIFASYAREDSDIVKIIDKAYSAFGNKYMRDLTALRSGQKWKRKILDFIAEADVFHLYWSEASRKSRYVEMEWHEALNQEKDSFVRPAYWEDPMPECPDELKEIHFSDISELVEILKKLILVKKRMKKRRQK